MEDTEESVTVLLRIDGATKSLPTKDRSLTYGAANKILANLSKIIL